jgi:hypothetical protein
VRGLPAGSLLIAVSFDVLVRNGIVVKHVYNRPYLAEGLVEVWAALKVILSGNLCIVLLAEGACHEGFELSPFWVLGTEMNMLKMPHPLQVLWVPVPFVIDYLASHVSEERVYVIGMSSCDGEFCCLFRVSRR